MFERFTNRARRVLVLAQEEARGFGHKFIGTEHLLLGMLAEGEGIAAKALRSVGLTADSVRDRITAINEPSSPANENPPFSPRAKKVLELSFRESINRGHNYIGTEHLLLGLISLGEGAAHRILNDCKVNPERVRQHTLLMLAGTHLQVVVLPDSDWQKFSSWLGNVKRPWGRQSNASPVKTLTTAIRKRQHTGQEAQVTLPSNEWVQVLNWLNGLAEQWGSLPQDHIFQRTRHAIHSRQSTKLPDTPS
jgi:ATP-dependent Clp protease ATP-binding subunit ClpA